MSDSMIIQCNSIKDAVEFYINTQIEKEVEEEEQVLELVVKTFTDPFKKYLETKVNKYTTIIALCNGMHSAIEHFKNVALENFIEQNKDFISYERINNESSQKNKTTNNPQAN